MTDKLYRLESPHESGRVEAKWVRAKDAEREAEIGREYLAWHKDMQEWAAAMRGVVEEEAA